MITLILRKSVAFWLTHVGLFLTLLFAGLGTFEHQRLNVRAFTGLPEHIAISDNREFYHLPFRILFKNFEAEFHENGQSKSYKADVVLISDDTQERTAIRVNHPARFMGYDIYLSSYDQRNPTPEYVILLVIYDPWGYAKYVAIIMLLIGLFLYIWRLKFAENSTIAWIVLVAGIGFCFIPLWGYLFDGKNLIPALRSWWFVPHIVVYMFSYAALSIACLLSIYILSTNSQKSKTKNQKCIHSSINFTLAIGTMLMGIGLLFGSLWAKEAWGGFWAFSLKENLAAIAWVAFLGTLHFRYFYKDRHKTLAILVIVAYLLLQLCWFGVGLFPESWQGLHQY
ncbi:MAG: cytochrome c biogenesis protein CcsA [Bacteroidales bacterium]|nr:cytochrome c biogenesis protein CcsA [Bacteroidales bacterium]